MAAASENHRTTQEAAIALAQAMGLKEMAQVPLDLALPLGLHKGEKGDPGWLRAQNPRIRGQGYIDAPKKLTSPSGRLCKVRPRPVEVQGQGHSLLLDGTAY